jgi:hypothetical protein
LFLAVIYTIVRQHSKEHEAAGIFAVVPVTCSSREGYLNEFERGTKQKRERENYDL